MNRLHPIALALLAGGSLLHSPAIARQPAPAKNAQGLDALTDDALLSDLARRGLTVYLQRAFEIGKTPVDKQRGMMTLIALRRLSDKSQPLTPAERQKLVGEVVKGIEAAIPSMTDSKLLMQQAFDLSGTTVDADVQALEYWGETARAQSQLNPVMRVVVKLLGKAADEAQKQMTAAADSIVNANDAAALKRVEELELGAATALYNKHMAAYELAISISSASPERKVVAREAIAYLEQFDVAENPDRGFVRLRLAKLTMAAGDWDSARKRFDTIITEPGNPTQQYEARYFKIVTDILSRKLEPARTGISQLLAWQQTALPAETQKDFATLSAILQYRVHDLAQQLATSDADKTAANDAAIATLNKLVTDRPEMRGVVFDQLANRLPDDAKLGALDPLLLQALVGRGEDVRLRADAPDAEGKKTLERAIAAARELVKTDRSGVDPRVVENSTLLIGFFLEKLSGDEPVGRRPEAANALLDFVDRYKKSSDNATLALDNAQAIIAEVRKADRDNAEGVRAYERFLPLAIGAPFNRHQFALEYARRLQLKGDPKKAIEYFRLMPEGDPNALLGQYLLTLSLSAVLESTPGNSQERPAMLTEIQKVADRVRTGAQAALDAGKDEAAKARARSMLVGTTLLSAELSRKEQGDAARALALLDGFESSVQGMADENVRLTDMLLIRVQALMALNRFDDATAQLVQLLNRDASRGGQIVFDLLQQLNTELERAESSGRIERVQQIARNRAQLTGFLVKWAGSSTNPAIKKLRYGYAVFDAEVQRFAAVQDPDAAARKAGLGKALALFESLETEASRAEWKATLPANLPKQPPYDRNVVLGIARSQYDLQNFAESQKRFSTLLADQLLGPAVLIETKDGQQIETDNEPYWESILKLIRSSIAVGNNIEESKGYLKQQYVRWGPHVGGRKLKDEFEALRMEIIADFDVTQFTGLSASPASAPATAPVP